MLVSRYKSTQPSFPMKVPVRFLTTRHALLLAFAIAPALQAQLEIPGFTGPGGRPLVQPQVVPVPQTVFSLPQLLQDPSGWARNKKKTEEKPAAPADAAQAVADAAARQFGNGSPQHLVARLSAASLMIERGDFASAEKLHQELQPEVEKLLQAAAGKPDAALQDLLTRLYLSRILLASSMERGSEITKLASEFLKLLATQDGAAAREVEIEVISMLVNQLVRSRRLAECRPWVKRLTEINRMPGVPMQTRFAWYFTTVARAARDLKMKEEAVALGDKAMELAQAQLAGGETLDAVETMLGLARIQTDLDKLLEAEVTLGKAQKIIETSEVQDYGMLAVVYNNLGMVHDRIHDFQGEKHRLELAEECFEKAYKITLKHNASDASALSARLNNLAFIRDKQGKIAEGLALRKQAFELAEKADGPNHPETLISYANYGFALESQGKVNDAVTIFRDHLKRSKAAFGDIHPKVADAYHNVGRTCTKLGQYNEAESSYERAAGIRERVFGTQHGETAKSYFNLGLLREAKEDYAGATAYFEHVMKIDRVAFGDDSEEVAKDIAALGRSLMAEGKYEEAKTKLKQSIAFVEKSLGGEHPYVAIMLHALALIEEKRENFKEAERLHLRMIQIHTAAMGDEHESVASSLANYAFFLIGQNKLTVAAAQLRRSAVILARCTKREGTGAADMRAVIDIYANVLRRLRYDEMYISKHIRKLEDGIDPVDEKGNTKA